VTTSSGGLVPSRLLKIALLEDALSRRKASAPSPVTMAGSMVISTQVPTTDVAPAVPTAGPLAAGRVAHVSADSVHPLAVG